MIAEKAVLGTIMKENYLLEESGLQVEHFSEAINRSIFLAMKDLHAQKKSLDMMALIMNRDMNTIDEIGGASYLSEMERFSNPVKFDEYCETVLDNWKVREKRQILAQATQEDWPQDKIITALTALETAKTSDLNSIHQLIAAQYDTPFVKREAKKGIETGLRDLDAITSGWQDADLIVVAARPSLGKTDTLLHFAKWAGWAGHLPVIGSLEMSAERLSERLLASVGRISRNKMRDPYQYFSEEQKQQWGETTGKAAQTNIQIYDAPGQTVAEIRAKVRKSMNEYPDKKPLVLIDYLTLIKPAEKLSNNHLQVGAITKALKAMAKEFGCPVIVLAQLSRAVEQRQDKRPMLSDLRESGSIEEDCDVAIMLYRESYYDKEAEDNSLELIVAKNRNGATGTVMAAYNRETGGIFNIDFSGNN